ncbi:MAG: NAD(P)-dependent oxidoreductase [Pseudomonadota bacterium]
MKILITGMSGLIGTALRAHLQDEHDLTAYNRSALDGVRCIRGDLQDLTTLRQASEGQDVVIHLAAKIDDSYGWEALRDTNVEGTRNVFVAATEAGVPRVVFASSGATVAGYEREAPYRSVVGDGPAPATWPLVSTAAPVRPAGIYGSTKVWGEALARHYSDTSQSQFVCVRLGYVNAEDQPGSARQRSVWCSQADAVQAFSLAALAPISDPYAVFFAGSANQRNYRDLAAGKALVGFVPQDGA